MKETQKDISKSNFNIYLVAILIALGIVIGMTIYSFSIYPTEKFSAIGVLDEYGGTTQYPKSVAFNSSLNFTVSVVNEEDMTIYYRIKIKYGNTSTVNSIFYPSINATDITHFDCILLDKLFIYHKLSFEIPVVQNNTKVIFELWKYIPFVNQFVYAGMWSHIWLNVTS